jgi:hypothetical protein
MVNSIVHDNYICDCVLDFHIISTAHVNTYYEKSNKVNDSCYFENGLKNTGLRAGRVAQVVECLPSKCEDLSSNSSTSKKRNKSTELIKY